ncbi:MAG TPA: nickel pincer cofactor biosynthesis protein LarC [Chloroflexota bacterium]|nr:nickel pincer cofactor biosynthesis protein LarC [Chloroflexota bacterium]
MPLAYLDCFSGASGDMILGALVGAGWTGLEDALKALNVPGWQLQVTDVVKRGISATSVSFELEPAAERRHLQGMLAIIAASSLPQTVKDSASTIFRRLAAVEAGIHAVDVGEVHFHELGGLDTLLDIVGACAGFDHFGFEHVALSAVAVGSGTVKTAHGLLPVPAPATAKLLEGWEVVPGLAAKELTTPTGAAVLTHFATSQVMPPMRLSRTAYGAGQRELDYPNVLRLLVGEPAGRQPVETVTVVETSIDDMSPELVPPAIEAILAAGALDAFVTPIQGKKGRPALLLTVLASPGDEDAVVNAIFRHTTTIGLRFRAEQRRTLPRHERTVETAYGAVRVKVSGEGALQKAKPEFEDCRRLAEEHNVPISVVYQAALAAMP